MNTNQYLMYSFHTASLTREIYFIPILDNDLMLLFPE